MGIALCILIAGDPARFIRFNFSCTRRSRFEISTNPQCACTGGFILCTILIGDRGACHIRRAGNGVVLHISDILGILAGNIGIRSILSFNPHVRTGVGQGVGLAVNLCRKGAAVRVKRCVCNGTRQLCLDRIFNAHLTHCVVQGLPDGVHLSLALFFGLLALVFYAAILRGRQGHFISEAPAEKLVLRYVQLDGLAVLGFVVDLAVRTQSILCVVVPIQSFNDLCVVQFLSSPIDPDLILPAVTTCILIAAVFLRVLAEDGIQKLTGDGLLLLGLLLIGNSDLGVFHLKINPLIAFLLFLFPGDGQLGGGLGGDLVVLNGDVGGAGLGVALCVQNGLGPGEGIGAVGVHRGLFGIHQLGDVFGGHLGGGFFLFLQLEGLLVAILRVGHFLYLVALALNCLITRLDLPADVRFLAQLLRQVDVLFRNLFLFLVQIALGFSAAGGGLRAGGHGGLGDGGGAVRVLLHSGRGGGVHNGLCAGVGLRLHVGLGLLGLFSGADLHFLGFFLFGLFLLGLYLFGLYLLGGSLTGAGVGVGFAAAGVGVGFAGACLAGALGLGVSLAAVGVGIGVGVGLAAVGIGVGLATGFVAGLAAGLAAALGVGHDHAVQRLGAVRVGLGMFFIVFDFRILQGLLSFFGLLVVLRFCGVFLFLGFLRHRPLFQFFRSCFRSICVCCQRACGHTGGQGHGHCRHLQFFVRHGSCSFPESCCLFQGVHRASIIAER